MAQVNISRIYSLHTYIHTYLYIGMCLHVQYVPICMHLLEYGKWLAT